MPTYYNNIKKVTSNLLDGGLSLAATGSRPTILVCGPAKKGLTNFPQLCVDAGDVGRFYGQDTVLEKKVAEILAQAGSEAYFIYVMRVGGTAPTIEIHDDNATKNILRITPLNYKDAQALERLGLVLIPHDSDGDGVDDEQRFVLYDLENEEIVWDSHDMLGDGEQLFEAELEINDTVNEFFSDSAGALYSHACDADKNIITNEISALMFDSQTNIQAWSELSTYPGTDFETGPVVSTLQTVATVADGVTGNNIHLSLKRLGNDGEKVPLMQRYAFLARALDDLAFNEFDYIIPVGSYFIDAPNIADCTDDGTLAGKILHHEHPTADTLYDSTDFTDLANITPSVPEKRIDPDVSQKDVLGWLWEGTHRNKRYYYFAKKKGWKSFEAQEIDLIIGEDNYKPSYTLTLEDSTGATHDIIITPGVDWAFSGLKPIMASPVNAVPSGSAGLPLALRINNSQTLTDAAAFLATFNAEINTLLGTVGLDYVSVTIPSTFTGTDTLTSNSIGGDFTTNVETPTGAAVSFKLAIDYDEDISSYEIDALATSAHSIALDGDNLKFSIFLTGSLTDLETALNSVSITGVAISSVSLIRDAASYSSFATAVNFIDGEENSTLEEEIELTWSNNFYTHEELTGEEVPSAIEAKFLAAAKTEFRECSFPHLVGSYCHESSTVWKTTMSCMSVQPPLETTSPFSGTIDIGQAPEYTSISGDLAIDTVNDGGTGILGNKFMAGAPGYRDQLLSKAANSSDGYAYGGLILTNGSNLPKGVKPYGIDDNDEAKDEKGFGIDIGKYIIPCGMWVTHSNSANGGQSYSGSLTGLIAAKIGITPFGEEPIGISNGRVTNISGPLLRLRYPYSSIDDLSGAGFATLIYRPARGGVTYINNLRTMAHKFSDYRKVSTVRSVNTVVQGIRELAEDYIGLAYNSSNVASLRTAINGYLRAQQVAGVHNGAVAQISFNRQDRILGNINIRLTMVPPFAIESITVTTSLVADESSL